MELITTNDLVTEIRDLAQERNIVNISDEMILRIMTRGQRFVTSEVVKVFPEPFIADHTPTPAEVAQGFFAIPKDAWEDRILYVEFVSGAQPYRVPWRRFDQTAALRMSGVRVPVPYAVYTMGRNVHFAGRPDGAYSCRAVYVRGPEPLVLSLGRITAVGSTYLAIERPDEDSALDLSTENDDLKSYFNVIDHQTGAVKGTFQVASLPAAGDRINVRSTPQRQLVQARSVSGSSSLADVASLDDYVCHIRGSCIPVLSGALNSFIVVYSAAELARALEETMAQLTGQISEVYRGIAQQQDIGRGTPIRVKNTSKIWSRLNPIRYLPGSK